MSAASDASDAELVAIGAAAVTVVMTTVGQELAGQIVGSLLKRFGVAWLRGQIDGFDVQAAETDVEEAIKFR